MQNLKIKNTIQKSKMNSKIKANIVSFQNFALLFFNFKFNDEGGNL